MDERLQEDKRGKKIKRKIVVQIDKQTKQVKIGKMCNKCTNKKQEAKRSKSVQKKQYVAIRGERIKKTGEVK